MAPKFSEDELAFIHWADQHLLKPGLFAVTEEGNILLGKGFIYGVERQSNFLSDKAQKIFRSIKAKLYGRDQVLGEMIV